jgi:hypothetical protein
MSFYQKGESCIGEKVIIQLLFLIVSWKDYPSELMILDALYIFDSFYITIHISFLANIETKNRTASSKCVANQC